MEEIATVENSNLYLKEESQSFLKETAKWGYFLSILGFVFMGLMVVFALFVGTIFSKINSFGGGINPMMGRSSTVFSVIYILIALLYFFPVYYLYQFSSKARKAFKYNDNEQLNASFEYLKSHYKFMGIIALIFVSFYAIIFIFTFLFGIFSTL